MPDDSGFPPSLPSSLNGLVGAGRQAFLNSISQHARLLTIETPLAPGALVVERFKGREGMSELFYFEVDCLSTSADFELKALTDQEVTLRLTCADGGTRSFHGMVGSSLQLGSDGALTRYRLTLVPWMQRLTHRRDNYVFQDKNVLEIIEEVLRDYPFASYRFDVKVPLPQRTVTMQYRESDFDFIARLLAEEGLNFYFSHDDDQTGNGQNQAGDEAKANQVHHKFVVFDDNAFLPTGSQATVRFNRAAATETADTVTAFVRRQQVQANAVTLASWDYKKLAATAAEELAADVPEGVPSLEVYEGAGAYRYTDEAESSRIVRTRAESLRLSQLTCHGEGTVRSLAVGTWFTLTGPDLETLEGDSEFTVLAVEHSGANNFFPGMPGVGRGDGAEPGTYCNKFNCTPRSLPIRPNYWRPKPKAPGAQIALVVCVAGEEITTERNHRVKIQFPWQRGDQATSGQSLHPSSSNAPGNDCAGTWVRVAEAAAGANWGGNFIPRIGQEVQIDFISGDIDRPVITGQVYNGADTPPFHGADNHPGALAGFKSKEYAASGFSQWVMDDTPSQLRQSLATSYVASQFNIGYLIRQNGNGRGGYRGTGLELATDAWSVLRAKRGLFMTTTQRAQASSTQLDSQEAQGKLKAAGELAKALSDASLQHQALTLSTADGVRTLGEKLQGKDSADGGEVPAFATPLALIDSAAGISVTTPASSVAFAGQDLTQTMHAAMRATAGQSVSMVAGKAASFFTHAGGAKVIAGNNPVSVQAHIGPMDVLADQSMTITSSNGSVKIQAKQEILLASGGGYIKLAGGNIDIHCPSSVSIKGASHDFKGGASTPASLPILPISLIQEKPESRLESTFAFDQLTFIARNSTKAEFIALVVQIFGFDIPAKTYIKLYENLRSGTVAAPKIKVTIGSHYPAEFDNRSRTILVHEEAAERATRNRDASWLLLTALLHEFGHYIDLILRQDLADKDLSGDPIIASDSDGDEGTKFAYQIAHYDFANTTETTYATYFSSSYSGSLKVNYAEARKVIQKMQATEAETVEGKRGTSELFGAGKGENHKSNPHGSFGHQSIEDALINAGFRDDSIRKQIYFGNWLRDYSQLIDAKIVRKPDAPKNFPKTISREELTNFIAVLAEEEFVEKPEEKSTYVVNQKNLGVYRAVEHIDNPTNNDPKATNPQTIDRDFEPPPTKAYIEVDPNNSMKRYIAASKEYMRAELNLAVAAGRTSEGLRHFGAALHVLEDYFAHSNFVELSLRKVGYKDVLPWTSPAPGKHHLPVVTGMFNSEDVIASTAGQIADTILEVEWAFQPKKAGERTKADRIVLIMLREHSNPIYLEQFKNFLKLRDAVASMPGSTYIQGALHYTIGSISNIYNFVFNSLLHLMGNSVDDMQVELAGDPNTNGTTNPSHSQLAKDHDNHPFHTLAAKLAKAAVLTVGKAMDSRWAGNVTQKPAEIAASYLAHPMDCVWQDQIVLEWAKSHPNEIKRGASATEWQALRREHEREIREKIANVSKQSKKIWDYINQNYEVIFNEKNQVKK